MKCVKCQRTIDDGDLFCGYCGINQIKFSKYLNNVSKKIHKERDQEYNNKVNFAKNKLQQLEKAKNNEINRIINSRWQSLCPSFAYNMTEGIIKINGNICHFSEIKGAEIIKNDSYRMVTTGNATSKKHVSVGKAVVGGALLGPLGAIAGSTMGKTTTSNRAVTNSIPTCTHIGVNVNINQFISEIIILNQTVNQSSIQYKNAMDTAQKIVDKLRFLSVQPEPTDFLKPEEEQSVLDFNLKIEQAEEELRRVVDDKPNYDIPKSYFE